MNVRVTILLRNWFEVSCYQEGTSEDQVKAIDEVWCTNGLHFNAELYLRRRKTIEY